MAAAHTIAPARADKRFHRSEISFVHLRHALDIGLSTRLQSNNRVAISIALKVYPRAAKALRLMGSAARLHAALAACQGHSVSGLVVWSDEPGQRRCCKTSADERGEDLEEHGHRPVYE